MSTYANGTQQTYEEIWATMEAACAALVPSLRAGRAVLSVGEAAVERAAIVVFRPRHDQANRLARRAARARRRTTARRCLGAPTAA